jgi:ketosteroid isomerase-like protein
MGSRSHAAGDQLAGCDRSPTGTQPSGVKPVDTRAQDEADLRTLEDRFMTAFRAKDVNAIMQFCVPDDSLVVFDVHPPRQYNGAAAYRKDWEEFFNRFDGPLQVDVSEMDATAGEDVAYVYHIDHVIGTVKDGKKRDFTVRITDCFKKINGKWLIAHTHVSVPVDILTGKADIESKP